MNGVGNQVRKGLSLLSQFTPDVGGDGDDDREGDRELAERRGASLRRGVFVENRRKNKKVTPSSSGCSCSTGS